MSAYTFDTLPEIHPSDDNKIFWEPANEEMFTREYEKNGTRYTLVAAGLVRLRLRRASEHFDDVVGTVYSVRSNSSTSSPVAGKDGNFFVRTVSQKLREKQNPGDATVTEPILTKKYTDACKFLLQYYEQYYEAGGIRGSEDSSKYQKSYTKETCIHCNSDGNITLERCQEYAGPVLDNTQNFVITTSGAWCLNCVEIVRLALTEMIKYKMSL